MSDGKGTVTVTKLFSQKKIKKFLLEIRNKFLCVRT